MIPVSESILSFQIQDGSCPIAAFLKRSVKINGNGYFNHHPDP
jgi:hypothetical protein